jgi:peptidoglycan/xylan/chitin deacetylase (PgdA/CDA1 family)
MVTAADRELDKTKRDYALGFASTVVGRRLTTREVHDELCAQIFEALSRYEEIATPIGDKWGCWDWQYSKANRRGELYIPRADRPLAQLRAEIQNQHPKWPLEPLWPDKKPFALCLTHDVDAVITHVGLRAISHTIRGDFGSNLRWRSRAGRARVLMREWLRQLCTNTSRPLRNFEEWLKLEDSFGFKSTFFFFPSRLLHRHPYDCQYQFHDTVHLGDSTMAVSEMMRTIDEAGWEIGLHGSYHSAIESGLLTDERQQIESIVGHAIISARQHWLHYDVQVTPRIQAEAGIKVDSTQGFNRSIGFRAGTAFPFWCWNHQAGQTLPILELPQHIMDGGLFNTNALEYDEAFAIQHSIEIMDAVEQVGGCLTLSWHPHNVNNTKYWGVYETLLAEAARRNAWGCSVGDLYRWWTARERRLVECESADWLVGKRGGSANSTVAKSVASTILTDGVS